MPFCPNCGAEVEGRYCAKCGAALEDKTPLPPPVPIAASAGGLPENTAAALCYVLGLITGIIFLVLAPYNQNKLIRFHAFQSIFLNVAVVIISWAITLILPWSVWRLLGILDLGIFVLWVYMLVMTYQGKKILLPVIGDLAAKQA